jgi:hypothetical protein
MAVRRFAFFSSRHTRHFYYTRSGFWTVDGFWFGGDPVGAVRAIIMGKYGIFASTYRQPDVCDRRRLSQAKEVRAMRVSIIALAAAALLAGGGLRWLETGGEANHLLAAIRQAAEATWPGHPCGHGPASHPTSATLTAARMSLPPPEPTVLMDGHM